MTSKNAPGEVFRDKELDKIMQHHRSEPSRVKSYKEWVQTTQPTSVASSSATLSEVVDAEGRDGVEV